FRYGRRAASDVAPRVGPRSGPLPRPGERYVSRTPDFVSEGSRLQDLLLRDHLVEVEPSADMCEELTGASRCADAPPGADGEGSAPPIVATRFRVIGPALPGYRARPAAYGDRSPLVTPSGVTTGQPRPCSAVNAMRSTF